ncbi:nucleolar protein 12 family protein [Pseudohyphozyma bogoriensis]|nr:nucleolar protein 12 family protein [Pseudohyphozyma bogoriensis]
MPKDFKKKRDAKGKDKGGRPAKIKRVKEVVWNDDARKEYLTGFSKRKKAREAAVRQKAISREKEELRESRQAIRDEKKERIAQNIKNEQELYGQAPTFDSDGSDGSDDDSEASDDEPLLEEEYDSNALHTTVLVTPMSFSRSPSPVPLPPPSTSELKKPKTGEIVETHKKRVKNKPAFRPKMTKEQKKERATGGKKAKKEAMGRNKATKGRANKG